MAPHGDRPQRSDRARGARGPDTAAAAGAATPDARRRIAWDRVSFLVPANWELALYKFLRRGVTRIEIEDECAVRLEAEWLRPKKRPQLAEIMRRYEKAARRLTLRADARHEIGGLPTGWFATRYTLSETVPRGAGGGLEILRHELVTAFYLCPESELFCFVILHVLPDDPEDPESVMRLVAGEFRHYPADGLVPWELFDLRVELPADFLLESTSFDIGAKRMVFRWKLRRFHLWVFSCADMFLKEGVCLETWVAGHLNGYAGIRGAVFTPGQNGRIGWRRSRGYLVADRDQIARWCFRYTARCRHDRARNQVLAWVFSHRNDADLEHIPAALRFDA